MSVTRYSTIVAVLLSSFVSFSYIINDSTLICMVAGSVMESTITAIEQASVVLMCISEKYKGSPKCRTGCNLSVIVNILSIINVSAEYIS